MYKRIQINAYFALSLFPRLTPASRKTLEEVGEPKAKVERGERIRLCGRYLEAAINLQNNVSGFCCVFRKKIKQQKIQKKKRKKITCANSS